MGRGLAPWTSRPRSPGCSTSPRPSRSMVARSRRCSHEPETHRRSGPASGGDRGLPAYGRSAQASGHRARGQPGRTDPHHPAAVREDRHRGVPDAPAGAHRQRRDGRGRRGRNVGDGGAGWGRPHEDPGARRRREQHADAARRGPEEGDDATGAEEARLSVPAPAIRCTGLVKRYGDVLAVAGLDLAVTAGECFGLLGPNGAGKTTTIEILEGLTPPDAGDVEILGLHWTGGAETRAVRERLGIQLQDTQLADKLTVEETVRLFASFYRSAHTLDEVLALVELDAPGALIASHGAEYVVELALADGAAPTVDELAALPGVRAVRPAPDRTALTVAEVHRAVPALLVLLERRGAVLSLLATHHATLEDVFVTLTGRQLRDA